MKKLNDDRKLLRGAFPKTVQELKSTGNVDGAYGERRRPTQFFAIAPHDDLVDHFKVYTTYGRYYAIKYAHLPHIVLESGELMILLHDLQILVKGRNLDVIEEHLSANQLLMLKPSPSGKDDGLSQVYISHIIVTGSIHELMEDLKNEEA